MKKLTVEEMTKRFMDELGYAEEGAQILADKLLKVPDEIWQSFFVWWENGVIEEITIEGVSAQTLVEKHNMKPPAVFTTLDWVRRDSRKAKRALRKGYDTVSRK